MQNKRMIAVACAALFAAGNTLAADPGEDPDRIVVRASPFDSHGELEMAQPASVLRGERLQRRQSTTLGDTLNTELGVQSSSFGVRTSNAQRSPFCQPLPANCFAAEASASGTEFQMSRRPSPSKSTAYL